MEIWFLRIEEIYGAFLKFSYAQKPYFCREMQENQIIIIGAGPAGLMAAQTLAEKD